MEYKITSKTARLLCPPLAGVGGGDITAATGAESVTNNVVLKDMLVKNTNMGGIECADVLI